MRQIQSPRMLEILKGLLSPPHPNRDVVIVAIDEAGKRGLKQLADPIRLLCNHYREGPLKLNHVALLCLLAQLCEIVK
jgi:hypothetical protein